MIEVSSIEFDDDRVSIHYEFSAEQREHVRVAHVMSLDTITYPELIDTIRMYVVALAENVLDDLGEPED